MSQTVKNILAGGLSGYLGQPLSGAGSQPSYGSAGAPQTNPQDANQTAANTMPSASHASSLLLYGVGGLAAVAVLVIALKHK